MENNFNGGMQTENQNDMFSSANNVGQTVKTNFNMGVVGSKQNILMGSLGALIGAVVCALLWMFVAKLGYYSGLVGLVGAILSIFLYEKLGKGLNIVGVVISVVLLFIAIYIGNRIGVVLALQEELNSLSGYADVSFSEANEWFEFAMEAGDDIKASYYKDLIMGYLYTIACSVAYVISKIKGRK